MFILSSSFPLSLSGEFHGSPQEVVGEGSLQLSLSPVERPFSPPQLVLCSHDDDDTGSHDTRLGSCDPEPMSHDDETAEISLRSPLEIAISHDSVPVSHDVSHDENEGSPLADQPLKIDLSPSHTEPDRHDNQPKSQTVQSEPRIEKEKPENSLPVRHRGKLAPPTSDDDDVFLPDPSPAKKEAESIPVATPTAATVTPPPPLIKVKDPGECAVAMLCSR